jgi:hypothetical protein
MNTLILGFLKDVTTICLIAIFFILVMTIYKVLKDVSFFDNKVSSVMVSICIALLSIMGMIQLFIPSGEKTITADNNIHKNTWLVFLLLPYVAIGITIILALLLKFILGTCDKYRSTKFREKYHLDTGKKHSSEKETNVWKNNEEEFRIRK